MPGLSAYANKLLLDYLTGAVAAAPPSARYIGLSLGTPDAFYASELDAVYGVQRQTCQFAEASITSAPLSASIAFGPFASSCTVVGVALWNAASAGNHLWQGTLATPVAVKSGGNLLFRANDIELRWR